MASRSSWVMGNGPLQTSRAGYAVPAMLTKRTAPTSPVIAREPTEVRDSTQEAKRRAGRWMENERRPLDNSLHVLDGGNLIVRTAPGIEKGRSPEKETLAFAFLVDACQHSSYCSETL